MKSKFLVVFCLFSVLSMTLAKITNTFHRKTTLNADNLYYNYIVGVTEIAGGNLKDVESCMPANWKNESYTEITQASIPIEAGTTIFQKLDSHLTEGIDTACKFKNDVIEFFKKKEGLSSYRRVFISLHTINGAKTPFDDIVPLTKKLFRKLKDMLNSEIFHKTVEVLKCLKTNKTAVVVFTNTVTNFIGNNIKLLSGLEGFIENLIELACQRKDFRDAISFLITGVKATDKVQKWKNYGQFFGKLVELLGKK